MDMSSDPYEQKLYSMFKSYDKNGTLDETALIKLCKSLELGDECSKLVYGLLTDKKTKVTFKEFKEALLNYLGKEMENIGAAAKHEIGCDIIQNIPDSPAREISPKLVLGSKKYGRRSRPQSLAIDSSHSDSENEIDNNLSNDLNKNKKVQRSSSQSEITENRRCRINHGTNLKRCVSLPAQKKKIEKLVIEHEIQSSSTYKQLESSVESLGNLDFENLSHTLYEIWMKYGKEIGTTYLNRHQLETVCERVGLSKVAAKVAEEVFENLNLDACKTISFVDFISLIQGDTDISLSNDHSFSMHSATSITQDGVCNVENVNSLDELHVVKDVFPTPDVLTFDNIVDIWQNSGITNPKKLLISLGFDEENVPLVQLLLTLEEELRSVHSETQSTQLFKAFIVLKKFEVKLLQQTLRQIMDENKKLCADNRDINRRAALLAQEIDERHATIEDSTKSEIKMLQQKHADVIKELTLQLSSDRENYFNQNSRLENRIKLLECEESKYKTEIQCLKNENSAFEKEQINLQKQITELLKTNIKLNNEIVEIHRNEDNLNDEKQTEEVLELIDKITLLQMENTNLRDKNDELLADVEGLNFDLDKCKKMLSTRSQYDIGLGNSFDDLEQSSSGIKRRGDSPSKIRMTEENPRLGKQRKFCNENSESETSCEWIALQSELGITSKSIETSLTSGFNQDISSLNEEKDEQIKILTEKITKLENEILLLKETQIKYTKDSDKTNEKNYLEKRCEELESSLIQMSKAYEDCEDYWQKKINDERQIYEYDQIENSKRLQDLMNKIDEYEEQFNKERRLSTIEEKDTLEQQYADLEAELEEIRENSRKIIDEKTKELNYLQDETEKLKIQLNESTELRKNILHGANLSEIDSTVSSPIDGYLEYSKTLQPVARDYQNPQWNSQKEDTNDKTDEINNQTVIDKKDEIPEVSDQIASNINEIVSELNQNVENNINEKSSSDEISASESLTSTSTNEKSSSISLDNRKEQLKTVDILKKQIKHLAYQKELLIKELQQLHGAKPVLEKAYARTTHPSLIQRLNQLEQKNRHLQATLNQQQHYTDTIMQQTWHQHRNEMSDLRNRIETQGMIINEQGQRLANADILAKDLFVENSNLAAKIQMLEIQKTRNNILKSHQSLNSVPGMP